MSIRSKELRHFVSDQRPRGVFGWLTEPAQQGLRGHLNQAPLVKPLTQAGLVLAEQGVALRVRDYGNDAAVDEPGKYGRHRGRNGKVGELNQQITAPFDGVAPRVLPQLFEIVK